MEKPKMLFPVCSHPETEAGHCAHRQKRPAKGKAFSRKWQRRSRQQKDPHRHRKEDFLEPPQAGNHNFERQNRRQVRRVREVPRTPLQFAQQNQEPNHSQRDKNESKLRFHPVLTNNF